MQEGLVVRRRRSPQSRSPQSRSPQQTPRRRQSFSDADVFLSPVEWSKAPHFDRDADEVSRILQKGGIMCREEISEHYIRGAMEDPRVAVWLVRDASARIFGFALTKQHASHLELKLICTHRRKGEGLKLFVDILAYAQHTGQELHLEAVNAKVATIYAGAAMERRFRVYVGDARDATQRPSVLKEALRTHRGDIPLALRPPELGERIVPNALQRVRSLKAALHCARND